MMKVKAGNYDVKNHYHLLKANELNTSHPDLQKQLLAYFVITSDTLEMQSTLENLKSPCLLAPPNGVACVWANG